MSKMRDKEYEKEEAAKLEDFKRKAEALQIPVPEDFLGQVEQVEVPIEIPVDNPELLKKIKELEGQIMILQEQLAEAINCEADIKKECEEAKQRCKILITENTKLTNENGDLMTTMNGLQKEIVKYKIDNLKLKKAVEELTKSV